MADQIRLKRRSVLGPILGLLVMVGAPTAVAAWYYYTVAVDRYVSEFRYSVRGGASNVEGATTEALVFAADSFVLEDYLVSLQAFEDIEKRLPLREMLSKDGGDPVRRYNPDLPAEDLMPHWERSVDVAFDSVTGITTARISMFSEDDALAVAGALVDELQLIVNGLTKQARDDMVAYLAQEYAKAEAELTTARTALETFRRENKAVSPREQISIDSEIMGELEASLTGKRAQLRTLQEQAPESPQIPILEEEIASLQDQLDQQFGGRAGSGEGAFATNLTEFDQLNTEVGFARENFIRTRQLKQEAEADAALNQAQLVVFVQPRLPTLSTDPDRVTQVAIIAAFAFLIWLAIRIFMASLTTQ
ncbi:MAG: hypothetical protein AAF401_02045 [Pseudomonadota bacterium]